MTSQIDPQTLARLIETDAVRLVDGSWALDGTDMYALYLQDHISGAQFFDIDAISDHTTDLPHMAPTPDQFANAVGAMGISETDHVVVYDRQGLFSAARVWWTFKLMGHDSVQVLKGGLPAWKAAGLAVTHGVEVVEPRHYTPCLKPDMVINLNDLHDSLDNVLVLDARSAARFEGTAPEPRAGLRSGHVPGARSLPFSNLISDGGLKPEDALQAILAEAGVSETRRVVTSCGSGVTAAILSMALFEVGHTAAKLYDGSWAEWGQASLDTPVAKGSIQ